MTITTKFDIQQQVFFMENNKVLTGKIDNLQTNVYSIDNIEISYSVSMSNGKFTTNIEETELFGSKELLLASL